MRPLIIINGEKIDWFHTVIRMLMYLAGVAVLALGMSLQTASGLGVDALTCFATTLSMLTGKTLGFCLGCLSCLKTKRCVIPDDVADIVQQMKRADVLVFATPIYYYEMCGQMKTLLDRANPLYADDYAFRDVYLLSAAAEDAAGVDARAVSGLEGWLECFEHARLAGCVFAGGVDAPGAIDGHPALREAYELGKQA